MTLGTAQMVVPFDVGKAAKEHGGGEVESRSVGGGIKRFVYVLQLGV